MAFPHSAIRRAYRIADSREVIFDGQGAAAFGGRWNSPGRRVIYAAETFAGAILEVLLNVNIGRLPRRHAWTQISIPEGVAVEELDGTGLPRWGSPDQIASRKFGDRWHDEKRSSVLIVPSVVTRVERNLVINQDHPDFSKAGGVSI